MAGISGKLLRVKFGDKYLQCQLDATLNVTVNTSEDETCKPSGATVESATSWITNTVDSVGWNISVNAKAFLATVGTELTQSDILELIVDGNLEGEAEFLTTPGQHNNPEDIVYEGNVIISNFSLNAPASGNANYDLDLLGQGKPTFTRIPSGT